MQIESPKLVIVESPGKVKKIASILGKEYRVIASVGHVRDLPLKEMGVKPPDFKPLYVPTERGKEVIARLKKETAVAQKVLLATDPDREGEAIAWHLAEILKLRAPERIVFTAITKERVLAAVANPGKIDIQRVRSQEARRVLDRIIGYRVSPALQTSLGKRVSAGRVQTPAVRLVVDREREIRTFIPTEYYTAELLFETDNVTWKAVWDSKPYVLTGQQYMTDQKLAKRASGVRRVTVKEFSDTLKNRPPAPPFTTSTLQQAASQRLKFRPKKTMDVAQKLYEQGAITYHRTDNPNIDPAGIADILSYAKKAKLSVADKPRRWKAREGAQEGHEAIRPTHVADLTAAETQEEKMLYKLIWQRAVASQLADAVYAVRTARLKGDDFEYIATGRTLKSSGWMSVYPADTQPEGADNPVPELTKGEQLEAIDGKMFKRRTQPPTRYTEATLVKELERQGIGRPSTYASIMEHIIEREYIKPDEKRYLVPTPLGESVRDALVGKFRFAEFDYTRQMEDSLDLIAQGKDEYGKVVSSAWAALDDELSGTEFTCEKCGRPMRRISGQFGFFWGCRGYPKCRATLPDINGRPGRERQQKHTASSVV